METNPYKRQGQMDSLQSYFYTDSIFEMKHLLADDNLKRIIIESWKYLVDTNKIKIYGFVIMPNHILRPGSCLHEPAFSNESHFIDRTEEIFTFL